MKIIQTSKINEALYLWFYSLRSRGPPILGAIIEEKDKFCPKNFLMKTKVSELVKVGYIDRKLFTESIN